MLLDDPDILILDEPMNRLDGRAIVELRTMLLALADKGKTIILASHYYDDSKELCKTVYRINNGKIDKNQF